VAEFRRLTAEADPQLRSVECGEKGSERVFCLGFVTESERESVCVCVRVCVCVWVRERGEHPRA